MPAIENRVRFGDYGGIEVPAGDPRLVPVVSHSTQLFLHWAAAERFEKLRKAAEADGFNLKVASGWRPIRFASLKDYEAFIAQRYGSVAEGRKWLAFRSGHNLGLSMDVVGHGLEIKSATAVSQKQLPVYRWLVDNAHRFGLTPYLKEPWHWEANIDLADFHKGSRSVWRRVLGVVGATSAVVAGVYLYRRARPRVVIIKKR